MKHVVLSDEWIEKMADTYRDQKRNVTFQEYVERELDRLKKAIG